MIFDAYKASRMALTISALSPSNSAASLGKTCEAVTRSFLRADKQRAKTASPIKVKGIPKSSAFIPVHLPVPFCPAVSKI